MRAPRRCLKLIMLTKNLTSDSAYLKFVSVKFRQISTFAFVGAVLEELVRIASNQNQLVIIFVICSTISAQLLKRI